MTAHTLDVLNRYPYKVRKPHQKADECQNLPEDEKNLALIDSNYRSTIRIMMYIFPREFGLHNVFTSQVDPRETVQPLKDYTLREEEITRVYGRRLTEDISSKIRVPKRLRGKAIELVKKLRISHRLCSYKELLRCYCPSLVSFNTLAIENLLMNQGSHLATSGMSTQQTTCDGSTAFDTQIHGQVPDVNPDATAKPNSMKKSTSRKPSLMDYATPTANVSAFCRSVLSTLIPNAFWGEGDTQRHNKGLFMKSVDRFIALRRFETLSLHDVIQGMKVRNTGHPVDLLGVIIKF